MQIQRAVLSHRHALQQGGVVNVEPIPAFPKRDPADRSPAAWAPEDHGWIHVGALLATIVRQNLERAPGEARRPLQAWDPSWLAPVRCPFPARWRPQWYLPWSLAARATQKSRVHAAILEWAQAHPESIWYWPGIRSSLCWRGCVRAWQGCVAGAVAWCGFSQTGAKSRIPNVAHLRCGVEGSRGNGRTPALASACWREASWALGLAW